MEHSNGGVKCLTSSEVSAVFSHTALLLSFLLFCSLVAVVQIDIYLATTRADPGRPLLLGHWGWYKNTHPRTNAAGTRNVHYGIPPSRHFDTYLMHTPQHARNHHHHTIGGQFFRNIFISNQQQLEERKSNRETLMADARIRPAHLSSSHLASSKKVKDGPRSCASDLHTKI